MEQHDSPRSSWTPDTIGIVERACAHYGGFDTWRAVRTIRLIPDRISGLLPWFKGAGRTFPMPASFDVFPHDGVARFVGYPDRQHVGIFHNGTALIRRRDDGAVVAESTDHRASFRGVAKYRRWTALDALISSAMR